MKKVPGQHGEYDIMVRVKDEILGDPGSSSHSSMEVCSGHGVAAAPFKCDLAFHIKV